MQKQRRVSWNLLFSSSRPLLCQNWGRLPREIVLQVLKKLCEQCLTAEEFADITKFLMCRHSLGQVDLGRNDTVAIGVAAIRTWLGKQGS